MDEEKKKSGETQVGADRWRAEDSEEVEGEKKDAGGDAVPSSHSSRERKRSRERRRSRSRDRHHSPARDRHRSRDDYTSSRRSRRGWSDEEDFDASSSSRFDRRGGRDFAHRHRRMNGPDPHAGMVWDGFTWNPRTDAPPAAQGGG